MSENRRSSHSVAKGAAGLLVLVVLLNVVPRVLPLPSLDLSSPGFPDLPELPGWVRKLVKAKNWALLGIAILVVAGAVAEEIEKRRGGKRDDT